MRSGTSSEDRRTQKAGFARRLWLFFCNNLVVTSIPFAVFPVVVFLEGPSAWASVAVGQALGALAVIGIEYGLAVSGPAAVAGMKSAEKVEYFARFLAFRLILCIPVTIVLICVSFLTAENLRYVIISALTSELVALDASWYFIGSEDPRSLLRYDTIPQALIVALGVLGGLLLKDIWIVLSAQLLAVVMAVVLSSVSILRHRALRRSDFSINAVVANLRSQAPAAGTSATAGLYVSLPTIMLALVSPTSVAAFAAAQSTQKYALSFVRPIIQSLQGWVPSPQSLDLVARAKRASMAGLGVAISTGVLLAAFIHPLVALLTGNQIVVPLSVSFFAGLTIAAIVASQIIGLACLPAFGLVRQLFISTAIGAAVGLTSFWIAAWAWGVTGAWMVLALSEVVVVTYQIFCLKGAFRRAAK